MTDKNNASGQAFPSEIAYGLSKRELFAGMALAGMDLGAGAPEQSAEWAFRVADAMIEESEK